MSDLGSYRSQKAKNKDLLIIKGSNFNCTRDKFGGKYTKRVRKSAKNKISANN